MPARDDIAQRPVTSAGAWHSPFQAPHSSWRPVGYSYLVETYRLDVVGPSRWNFVWSRSGERAEKHRGIEYQVRPERIWPGPRAIDHLIFAVRHEQPDLEICRVLFREAGPDLAREITEEVEASPTSAFRRRIWYLWETLTGERLPLENLSQGNYVPLMNPEVLVTGRRRRIKRQRVDVNLLGDVDLSPVVRQTATVNSVLTGQRTQAIRQRLQGILSQYDANVIRRALSFLYTRETRASFAIESETPGRSREERFIQLLRRAPDVKRLDESILVELQNETVDPRYANRGWRDLQIYVGESLDLRSQRVHYVAPRETVVPQMMEAFLELSGRWLEDESLDPILVAGLISFLFVLIHPFEDGNGRLHRWLIRWVLDRRRVTPPDVVIPVSAVMLARRQEYDEVLESFSRPLVRCVDYVLDDLGRMTVQGETLDHYRYPDLTPMVEALARWLDVAIDEELTSELDFLVSYDQAKAGVQSVVDMPDRKIDLFIKFCRQGGGSISKRKRTKHFPELTDDEVSAMEEAVRRGFAADE